MRGLGFSRVIIKGNDKRTVLAFVHFIATFSHSQARIRVPYN